MANVLVFFLLYFKPIPFLLEDRRSETSSKADNQTSNLLDIGVDLF